MQDKKKISVSNLEKYAGVYNDLAEILGADSVEVIFKNFKGQQITFPQRLYSKDYVIQEIRRLTIRSQ